MEPKENFNKTSKNQGNINNINLPNLDDNNTYSNNNTQTNFFIPLQNLYYMSQNNPPLRTSTNTQFYCSTNNLNTSQLNWVQTQCTNCFENKTDCFFASPNSFICIQCQTSNLQCHFPLSESVYLGHQTSPVTIVSNSSLFSLSHSPNLPIFKEMKSSSPCNSPKMEKHQMIAQRIEYSRLYASWLEVSKIGNIFQSSKYYVIKIVAIRTTGKGKRLPNTTISNYKSTKDK